MTGNLDFIKETDDHKLCFVVVTYDNTTRQPVGVTFCKTEKDAKEQIAFAKEAATFFTDPVTKAPHYDFVHTTNKVVLFKKDIVEYQDIPNLRITSLLKEHQALRRLIHWEHSKTAKPLVLRGSVLASRINELCERGISKFDSAGLTRGLSLFSHHPKQED